MLANRSKRRPTRQSRIHHQYCARSAGLPCIHGPNVPHERCEIMGPVQRISAQSARKIAADGLGSDVTPEQREAIVAYMATWGHCLWHAASRVLGRPCPCRMCDPSDPSFPWSASS